MDTSKAREVQETVCCTAKAMADGLQNVTGCDVALCTTGIAGPTGGTSDKPVGLMYTSVKYNDIVTVKEIRLPESTPRIEMKQKFADEALKLALATVKENRIA